MLRKRKKNQKILITVIDKEDVFQAKKPRYNAHQGGYGVHEDDKVYTRKSKYKKGWDNYEY